ncbi:MAG: primosomal protein N' [Nitrospirota bacterium]
MQYLDVVFPLNLGPLTYRCPEDLLENAQPGMIITAPLKNRLTKGIIFKKSVLSPQGKIKEIVKVHGDSPVLSRNMLKLLRWMSDYYISPEGLVLKQTLPKEIFSDTHSGKSKKEPGNTGRIPVLPIPEEEISPLLASVRDNVYHTYLLHSPSLIYEYSIASALLNTTRNIIVLFPEVSQANMFFSSINDKFKDRACLLHGETPKGRRSEYIAGILSGKYDIVVGTRPALFSPLKSVSLIITTGEHNSSYKPEEGVRYNIRDVAVMRGFIEKAPVLLSSVTPSIDSYYNALSGKYRLISPDIPHNRPVIRIIDMRFEKKIRPNISRTVFERSKNYIKNNRKIIFVINRRGYSTTLLCNECGHIEKCGICNMPVVLHKSDNVLKCHYCGKIKEATDSCTRCKSYNLELLGSGTQRVQEDIGELFGVETIRFDSDKAKNKSEIDKLLENLSGDSSKIAVCTKMLTKRIGIAENFSMAAILNIDGSLNLPDFRASEKAYMEISSIAELIKPDGEIFIQTRFPGNDLFKYFKAGQYVSFVKKELSARKELNYPPYSKLLNIIFTGRFESPEKLLKTICGFNTDIDIFGPIKTLDRKGNAEYSFLLKSPDRKALNTAARKILEKYEKAKDAKIRIDVDPL